jgi:uncharacterized protein (DUF1778 family)
MGKDSKVAVICRQIGYPSFEETTMTATTKETRAKSMGERSHGARLDIRTTKEIRRVIEHAAVLQGMTVSEYAKAILLHHAQEVVERHETRRLSDRDRDLFLDLLDNPPAPNDSLRAAAADFRQAVEDGSLIP